ncbi:uncharacterized protein DSM5745_08255 [Aspergillus mulundensis]|uniref:Methyltransferase domain-containing protein n=1 Tax=Aspergillus mulundensis TaxID=1810919 RepID=A0A3D8RA52_9EURO|nr:hypothetical protein DSM5745_08255 [Aspergillus mulundensis]RDW70744.1 hypothetical protein DSM5745_08255 [Aspergillus mulundensis]
MSAVVNVLGSHHIFTMLLDNKLVLAPVDRDIQVRNKLTSGVTVPETNQSAESLDVGTGTGIWAIDFAEDYPFAEVIGTDLSPIQPSFVPPNLRFEIDDATETWVYPENHFDLVHVRSMYGAVALPIGLAFTRTLSSDIARPGVLEYKANKT